VLAAVPHRGNSSVYFALVTKGEDLVAVALVTIGEESV